ncbi:hypothetical protein MY149_08585 [Acinetobacter indicus]|nr:hypothetical protein [Acinetobacter indicus]
MIERHLLGHEGLDRLISDLNVVTTLKQDCAIVNIIGDTYLGEYYTERRRKRKVFDPLLNHGYDYSFEKLNFFKCSRY